MTLIFSVICMFVDRNEGYTGVGARTQYFGDRSMWDPQWRGPIHNDCYKLNKDNCMDYQNCGLCNKDGQWRCIPGSQEGPLFDENCGRWFYTDYKVRDIFDEKATTISRPEQHFYPQYYESRWPSRQSVQTLMY